MAYGSSRIGAISTGLAIRAKTFTAQVERGKQDAADVKARLADARKQLDQTTAQQTTAGQQLNALLQQVANAKAAASATPAAAPPQ